MDDVAIGRLVGVIRRRLGLRQADVAERAEVSQQLVSLLETGGLGTISLGAARAIVRAMGAELVVQVRWRGTEVDRVRDEGHAGVVAAVAALLEAEGWLTAAEVTYSTFGEGGSIDLLAFHPETRILLVSRSRRRSCRLRRRSGATTPRSGWRRSSPGSGSGGRPSARAGCLRSRTRGRRGAESSATRACSGGSTRFAGGLPGSAFGTRFLERGSCSS